MTIQFEVIPHRKQRYRTVGDYFRPAKNTWIFRISHMKDKRYIWLVFLHEIIEWGLCQLQGVKMRAIDQFDMDYEKWRADSKERAPCGCPFGDDPGDDPHAPYRNAHLAATECERIIAKALGVDWLAYDEAVNGL